MNQDDIINSYNEKFSQTPSLDIVEKEREETLKKVSNSQVLAGLKDRIVESYHILADVSRGERKMSASKVALLVGGLAYLALPLDIVCDAIPIAGLLDDAVVLSWIFARCADLFAAGAGRADKEDDNEGEG